MASRYDGEEEYDQDCNPPEQRTQHSGRQNPRALKQAWRPSRWFLRAVCEASGGCSNDAAVVGLEAGVEQAAYLLFVVDDQRIRLDRPGVGHEVGPLSFEFGLATASAR